MPGDEREQVAAVLPREPKRITISGKEVVIRVPTVMQVPVLLDILEAMQADLKGAGIITPEATKAGLSGAGGIPTLQVLIRHAAKPLLAFASLVTGETEEWIGALSIAEGVKLYAAVLEENTSFFVESLLPAMNDLVPGARRLAALWGGLKSSPDLSETGTGSATFTDIT